MTDRPLTSWTLAVDFGTSFTVAAVRVDGRPPEAIEIAGERRMPTVVLVDDDGTVLVGRVADDLAASSPGRALRAPKRRLGEPAPVVLGGRAYQVVDLVAAVLRHVYDEAVRHQGSPPDGVRLTHPATWSRPRLARLLEAAAKAGLPQAVLIAEPVAAAMSYASEVGVPDGAHVAVYDLGGGTFDTTVLVADGTTFSVVGRPGGDANLGGELFDELLTNAVGERLDPDAWERLQVSDELAWRQAAGALRAEVRRAKEALTSAPYAELLVPLPTGLVNLRLTRDELEGVVGPYIDESIRVFLQCVRDAGVEPSALAAVYLVGGASRMPLVERRLSAAVGGVPVSRRGDPKTAVALGATQAEPSGSVLDLQAAGGRTTLESDAGAAINALLAPPAAAAPAPAPAVESAAPGVAPPPPPPSSFPSSVGPADATAAAAAFDERGTTVERTVVDGAGTVVESATIIDRPVPPPPPGGPPSPVTPPAGGPARNKVAVLAGIGAVALLLVGGIAVAATRSGDGDAAPTTTAAAAVTPPSGPVATLVTSASSPTTRPVATTTVVGAPTTAPAPNTTTPTTPAPTVATTPAPPAVLALSQAQLDATVLNLDEVATATGLTGWVANEFVPGPDLCGISAPDAPSESHTVAYLNNGSIVLGATTTALTFASLEDLTANYDALLLAARACPNPNQVENGVTFKLTFTTPVEGQVPLVDRAVIFGLNAQAPSGVVVRNIIGCLTKGRSAVLLGYQVLGRNLEQADFDASQELLTQLALKLVTAA